MVFIVILFLLIWPTILWGFFFRTAWKKWEMAPLFPSAPKKPQILKTVSYIFLFIAVFLSKHFLFVSGLMLQKSWLLITLIYDNNALGERHCTRILLCGKKSVHTLANKSREKRPPCMLLCKIESWTGFFLWKKSLKTEFLNSWILCSWNIMMIIMMVMSLRVAESRLKLNFTPWNCFENPLPLGFSLVNWKCWNLAVHATENNTKPSSEIEYPTARRGTEEYTVHTAVGAWRKQADVRVVISRTVNIFKYSDPVIICPIGQWFSNISNCGIRVSAKFLAYLCFY